MKGAVADNAVKFLLFADSTTLKPAGMLSGLTINDWASAIESSATPIFPHWGQIGFSTQRSRLVIL
jgi:hypothetical protein